MAKRKPARDVVVLLPGILGSVLQRDGKDVWAFSKGAAWRGLLSLGRSVKDLRLDHDDPEKRDLGDGVVASTLMPDIHLVPMFWKIDGYGKIGQVLQSRFDLVSGRNWFDFPYDWRRDNRAAAHRLAEQAPAWLDAWRKESNNPDAKLVLVGHSMGGLVARYYLEALDGWKDTRALVTFGTPYQGSLNALDFLANGFTKGFGPFKLDLTDMLRSLTSVHQLLPTFACVDDGTGTPRTVLDAEGLPAVVDRQKVAAAFAFHDEIAKRNEANGGFDDRYEIQPIAGIFQKTGLAATARNGTVVIEKSLGPNQDGGDGTVPRRSATPKGWNGTEVYSTEAHSSLQNVDSLLVQLMGILSEMPAAEVSFRGDPLDGFSLEVDDLAAPTEPLEVRVSTQSPAPRALVSATDVDTGATTTITIPLVDGEGAGTLAPLPPGIYRVTVGDEEDMTRPVTDLVVVADDATMEEALDQLGGQ